MSKFDSEVPRLHFEPSSEPTKHNLRIKTGSPMAEAVVIDGNFKVVARGTNELTKKLVDGRYKLKVKVGDSVKERWINLDQDREVSLMPEAAIKSSAPIDENAWPNDLFDEIMSFGAGANCVIVVRDPIKKLPQDSQIQLLDSRNTRIRAEQCLLASGTIRVFRFANLEPGSYRIRVNSRIGSPVEMSIWIAERFQTQLFLERADLYRLNAAQGSASGKRIKERAPFLQSSAMLFYPLDSFEQQQVEPRKMWIETELMKGALSRSTVISPVDELNAALYAKFRNPMLGLLGAHQLLRLLKSGAELPATVANPNLLSTVVDNLGYILGDCPDVSALKASIENSSKFVMRNPPMLWNSWSLVVPNAHIHQIPDGSLASDIASGITNVRPWLVWRTTDQPDKVLSGDTNLIQKVRSLPKKDQQIGSVAHQFSLPRSAARRILKKM